MKRVILTIGLALVLFGCKGAPVYGYVVGKEYVPSRTTIRYNERSRMMQVCRMPNEWVIWVADSCEIRSFRVDKATFDTLDYGDRVKKTDCY